MYIYSSQLMLTPVRLGSIQLSLFYLPTLTGDFKEENSLSELFLI